MSRSTTSQPKNRFGRETGACVSGAGLDQLSFKSLAVRSSISCRAVVPCVNEIKTGRCDRRLDVVPGIPVQPWLAALYASRRQHCRSKSTAWPADFQPYPPWVGIAGGCPEHENEFMRQAVPAVSSPVAPFMRPADR